MEYKLFHKQQYTEDSYIWVNEVLNMEGGDNYAIRRIHPNLVDTEGEYLSTSMQDSKGNYPYKTELEGIRKNGEVVQQYYFKNKSNDKIGKKISYAAFYEPFKWIVAMGTPMNAIIGFTNIARKHDPGREVIECLDKIDSSSEHLLSLINDVLDFSRIERGECRLVPVPVDISSVTNQITDIMQGVLANRDIDFQVTGNKPEKPYVLADIVRIQDILVNILTNAVKFTSDGGSIRFESEYRSGEDEQHIIARYRISDTGVGMDEEFVKHIFDEFAQEEKGARTQYKGTGLGMAITKRYVDLMCGTIDVDSKKGIGSTFTVELPLELTNAENVRKQETNIAKTNLTGVRILMAEDNDLNAEIATIQLEEYGMQVTVASNGKEAVKVFESCPANTFDVILMDLMMPA